jgi:argininosuccinate lyase
MWGGRFSEATDAFVAEFTASVTFDKRLYKHDIQGSCAHATMLAKSRCLNMPNVMPLSTVWLRFKPILKQVVLIGAST